MYIIKDKDGIVINASEDIEIIKTTLAYRTDCTMEETTEDWQLIDGIYRIGGKTIEEISQEKRNERNHLLEITDKFMILDYPISDKERNQYKEYRQYLRDIPNLRDFPNVDIMSFDDWFRGKSNGN